MQAFAKHIIAEPIRKETKNSAGIILDHAEDEKYEEGRAIVIAAGEGVDIPLKSTVYFKKHTQDEMTIDKKLYWVINSVNLQAYL